MTSWKRNNNQDNEGAECNAKKYIDMCVTTALTVVPKGIENGQSMSSALLALTISVDQLENICRANGLIDENDKEFIDDLAAFEKAQKGEGDFKTARVANFKMRLLLNRVFSSGIIETELQV